MQSIIVVRQCQCRVVHADCLATCVRVSTVRYIRTYVALHPCSLYVLYGILVRRATQRETTDWSCVEALYYQSDSTGERDSLKCGNCEGCTVVALAVSRLEELFRPPTVVWFLRC